MKNIFSSASILLYLLSFIVFFLAGATYTAISGAAQNQGLAGGGIVFVYGIIASAIGITAALFIAYRAERRTVVKANWILTALLLVLVAITYYRSQQRQAEVSVEIQQAIATPTLQNDRCTYFLYPNWYQLTLQM